MISAAVLISAQYAPSSAASMYSSPGQTTTIIDKFTATNVSGGSVALTIYLVANGGSPGASNTVIAAYSISSDTCKDFTELQNQILNPGDFISVLAGTGSDIVVRASGRQIV